jgi:hypothetical protein
VWKCGIQAGIATVIGRSSRYLSRISAKEVLEGTRGCCIAGSDTTRNRLDISQTSDQDVEQKESCHKAQDDQVLQGPVKQPYGRRSNMGKRDFLRSRHLDFELP